MAIVIDGATLSVIARCERAGCDRTYGYRPWPGQARAEVLAALDGCIREVIDGADGAGWVMAGSTWCPAHGQKRRPGRRTTVADGFAWARVDLESVKGAERRSGPLTDGLRN